MGSLVVGRGGAIGQSYPRHRDIRCCKCSLLKILCLCRWSATFLKYAQARCYVQKGRCANLYIISRTGGLLKKSDSVKKRKC